ncbi:EVE domain-containing protein [Neobacillus sp. CF12]|nr:EVE domain-containing protein [Neobacillus sp. CF12]
MLPQYYERIVSWGHKKHIINAYSDLITDPSINDNDDKLYVIREKLAEKYPNQRIDFYRSPVQEVWRETKTKDTKNLNYFIIVSDPATWKVEEIKDGSVVHFTAYNDNGNRRQSPKAFEKIKKGDLIVFYESTPTRQIIPLGEAVMGLHKNSEEVPGEETDVITIKYKEDIHPITWSEIVNNDVLKEGPFVRQGARGTLFELTKEQYNLIAAWEYEEEDH